MSVHWYKHLFQYNVTHHLHHLSGSYYPHIPYVWSSLQWPCCVSQRWWSTNNMVFHEWVQFCKHSCEDFLYTQIKHLSKYVSLHFHYIALYWMTAPYPSLAPFVMLLNRVPLVHLKWSLYSIINFPQNSITIRTKMPHCVSSQKSP